MLAMAGDQGLVGADGSSGEAGSFKGFGAVPGVREGRVFKRIKDAGAVHRAWGSGICGTRANGAESIVVSGGYEDDIDLGDVLIYTGHGGRDSSGRQVKDQEPTTQNESLYTSFVNGKPVRVIRAINPRRSDAGKLSCDGYRYDGLYLVDDFWTERGRSGYLVYRSKLIKVDAYPVLDGAANQRTALSSPDGSVAPGRYVTTTQRVVRTTAVAEWVKNTYDYTCQVCNVRLSMGASAYAEAAHIRPLGAPHHGPDVVGNVLCLCPNHHVLFDRGGLVIEDDLTVIRTHGDERIGVLVVKHDIERGHLRYHRQYHEKVLQELPG